jgi:hypothetical protein
MKVLLKVAVKHPIWFSIGVYRGVCKTIRNYRDPNHIPMSEEVRKYTIKNNLDKLKKFV